MNPVSVRIMHPAADPGAGPLERWVATARADAARRHEAGFRSVGADDVTVVTGPAGAIPFGARLRELVAARRAGGLVVLGSGAIPLATRSDRLAFVAAAGAGDRRALANNVYSADAVAIACVETLPAIPDLPADNAVPRWLAEVAGYRVDDLRRRWRLAIDVDSPLDLVLLGQGHGAPVDLATVEDRLDLVRAVAADHRAELVLAGRTSAATLAWLERHADARSRAWVEERGLRAASRLAQGDRAAGQRPPASLLGALLERDGPGSLGGLLARFGDAAIVDTRVLLAHRLGADESAWPVAEDRFASDLLLPDAVGDPWLRELTASAAAAPIPILLGGHSLVGPGVRLVVGKPLRVRSWT
jgi:hypothetical protein